MPTLVATYRAFLLAGRDRRSIARIAQLIAGLRISKHSINSAAITRSVRPKLPESRLRGTLARVPPQRRRCSHTPKRRHFHWRQLSWPFARPIGTRDRAQRRMSPIWEFYYATRSRSSLHTEAPTEPLRERPDQSETRRATFGVLQIEAEPLVLHAELV
jgi:hypothetical protein